jgi:hypothetical protein
VKRSGMKGLRILATSSPSPRPCRSAPDVVDRGLMAAHAHDDHTVKSLHLLQTHKMVFIPPRYAQKLLLRGLLSEDVTMPVRPFTPAEIPRKHSVSRRTRSSAG